VCVCVWACVGIMERFADRVVSWKATMEPNPDLHKHAVVLRTWKLLKKQESMEGL
jgi:hypothetical protein